MAIPEHTRPIAVFVSFSGSGGVERMVVNLIRGFVDLGRQVDLLPVRTEGPHFERLPRQVNRVRLGPQHTFAALPALARYLRRHRPVALLAAKDRAGRAAVLARRLAGADTRIVMRLGTNVSTAMAEKTAIARRLRFGSIRRIYPRVDQIVAVSAGVADDTARVAGIARAHPGDPQPRDYAGASRVGRRTLRPPLAPARPTAGHRRRRPPGASEGLSDPDPRLRPGPRGTSLPAAYPG